MKFSISNLQKGGVVERKDMIVQKVKKSKARILTKACIGIVVTGLLVASEVHKQKLEENLFERVG